MTDPFTVPAVPVPVPAEAEAPPVEPEPEPLVQAAEAFPEPVVTEPAAFHQGADYRPPAEDVPVADVPETLTLESLAKRVEALEAK